MNTPLNLPVEAYFCPDWYKREQALIFEKTWQFAGFVDDLPDPGDFVTVQVGRVNLVVVRGQDQRLRCFHNMCRHRGTQLLRATGKAQKALTCPYHDWTYALSGELVSVPEEKTQFPMLQKDKLCLHRGSVETWCGMVFVHADKEPSTPFSSYFDGVEEKLGPHRPEELVEFPEAKTDHVIAANWKIVAENYIDVYHLSHLHSGTLNMYDHAKAQFEFVGPHYMFFEPMSADYAAAMPGAAPMPIIDHLGPEHMGAYVPLLFPNLGLAETESSWSIFHIIPQGPESTRVITRSKVMNKSSLSFAWQAMKAFGGGYWAKQNPAKYNKSAMPDDPMTSGNFMAEDIFACEQQQKSLHSPLFSVGASAQHTESSVRQFQCIIRDWMQQDCQYRICGPGAMNREVKAHLMSLGVEPERIAFEQFGAGPAQALPLDELVDTQCKVQRGPEQQVIAIPKGQTLLEGLRAHQVEVASSCESGVCGTCVAQLEEGEVQMAHHAALDAQELASNMILVCQARAKSKRLKLRLRPS